jgi:hypothetical protein
MRQRRPDCASFSARPMGLGETGADRRRHRRMPIQVPVRVRGREGDGTTWEEVTSCVDVGLGGVGMLMSHPVSTGRVLHLSVPLPVSFRQYDLGETSYQVYALVRNTRPSASVSRVGVVFLGRNPPGGGSLLPAEHYRMPGDQPIKRPQPRPLLRLHLEADQAPGGVAQDEEAVAEHLAPRLALVRVRHLLVSRGAILAVEEVGGDFRSRAAVSSIVVGADGQPRLSLHMLDARVPDRLLTPDGETTDN